MTSWDDISRLPEKTREEKEIKFMKMNEWPRDGWQDIVFNEFLERNPECRL